MKIVKSIPEGAQELGNFETDDQDAVVYRHGDLFYMRYFSTGCIRCFSRLELEDADVYYPPDGEGIDGEYLALYQLAAFLFRGLFKMMYGTTRPASLGDRWLFSQPHLGERKL